MLQLILQELVLALQFVLLAAYGWLFSLLLLSSLTLMLQYRFTLVVRALCNLWYSVCCVPVTLYSTQ